MGSIWLNWKNGYEPNILGWAELWLRGEENRLCRQGKCYRVNGVIQGGALDALEPICLFSTLGEADLKAGVC